MRTKYEYLNKMHLVLLQHIFPNHGKDVVSNSTDEAALKEEEKNVIGESCVILTSHEVIQMNRHSTVGHH